jgi:hypothetical protein
MYFLRFRDHLITFIKVLYLSWWKLWWWLANNELERMWKEVVSQDSWYPGWDLNPWPPSSISYLYFFLLF